MGGPGSIEPSVSNCGIAETGGADLEQAPQILLCCRSLPPQFLDHARTVLCQPYTKGKQAAPPPAHGRRVSHLYRTRRAIAAGDLSMQGRTERSLVYRPAAAGFYVYHR